MTVRPTLRLERRLLRNGALSVACIDEVGRGALAGPVTVGVVVVSAGSARPPRRVRDSKALTADERAGLLPHIQEWAVAWSVGHASAGEIDSDGIMGALRTATMRALGALASRPDAILLDGDRDFLTARAQGTLWGEEPAADFPQVTTVVRGDGRCVGIACASIVAKCARDELMVDLASDFPQFQWQQNKGYGTKEHLAAIERYGASSEHRRSWRLPTPAA